MKTIYFIFVYSIFTTFLFSTIINVPADQPSIQMGLNVSVNSDTVLVQPGTYFENINYNGKNITIGSLFLTTQDTTYISQTIIDGNNTDSVVIFESGEDTTAVLYGFTITNGHAYEFDHGGGIRFRNSNASLSNLNVTGNIADGSGGGIFCIYNSNPCIKNVTISYNNAFSGGGIKLTENSNPRLINVIVTNNSADYSGGIRCTYSSPSLDNVTISNNTSISWGNGISCHLNSNPILKNCILWNDTSEEIVMQSGGDPNSITISYTDIQGGESGIVTNNNGTVYWLEGNIDSDPLFVDPLAGDFHLTENSPCINTGDPSFPLDPDGTRADMGAYYYHHTISNIINIPADYPTIQEGIDVSVTGDTILVQPGTYVENINYNGKNITVASLFLTTQDTSYISQTIIDGNQNGRVVTFDGGGYFYAVLSGFSITNGNASGAYPNDHGGGIYCNSAYPSLENLTISGNCATGFGGGIYCHQSDPSMLNVKVADNNALYGGGIFCILSSPILLNTTISGNTANKFGGGIYCNNNSVPHLENVTISDNSAVENGSGIYFYNNSSLSFNSENRCNIYSNTILNTRGFGTDFFAKECEIIHIIVDTFTVMTPTDHYASPIDNFTFDILHSIIDSLINGDVYVSVEGNDSNSGSSPDLPFKTISHALERVYSDSINSNTIHLADGVYSNSTNGEIFPLHWSNFVNLSGSTQGEAVLDAEHNSRVIMFNRITEANISNITIKNGYTDSSGGGIFCRYSSPNLQNVTILDNEGSGISCYDSSPSLENVTLTGNSAFHGGGIRCSNSHPILTNVTITDNYATHGGVIFCSINSSMSITNSILWNDTTTEIYCQDSGDPNSITISYTDIQGGEAEIVTNNNGTIYWLQGNIDQDPLFVNPLVVDYHLTENSPCIDAGDPSFPFDPDNTICDMGAFYYHQDQSIIVEEIYPEPDSLTISEGDSINFYINAIDPDGNPIEYSWELDTEIVSTDSCYTFYTDENSAGSYAVTLDITDNYYPLSRDTLNFVWEIVVEDGVITQELLPAVTTISQNYPNPFNPTTTIKYSLNNDSKVSLNIYNIKGQKVKQLVNSQLVSGKYSVVWNGKDDNGKSVSSGIFFYKLETNNCEKTKKMILLK